MLKKNSKNLLFTTLQRFRLKIIQFVGRKKNQNILDIKIKMRFFCWFSNTVFLVLFFSIMCFVSFCPKATRSTSFKVLVVAKESFLCAFFREGPTIFSSFMLLCEISFHLVSFCSFVHSLKAFHFVSYTTSLQWWKFNQKVSF